MLNNNSHIYGVYSRRDLAFVSGKGSWLEAEDGRKYLDCFSGIAVNAFGYAHPELTNILKESADKIWHISNLFTNKEQLTLAKKLCDITFADKIFFANSGAEAVECAIKTCRRYHFGMGNPERFEIITFLNSFHGRTMATIAAGGKEQYKEGFEPRLAGFKHIELGDEEALLNAINKNTAGILLEPIMGEGGIFPVADEFLQFLRETCDKHGILLIYDEIQCGYGRTGKMFAHQWSGVAPDIMCVAKGMGAGFPVGACLATEKVAQFMVVSTHGSTFGGNPLAMRVALKVLELMQQDNFLASVVERGNQLKEGLLKLKESYPQLITDVRGKGLMIGVKPSFENTKFIQAMEEKSILVIGAGDNIVRFLPPLIISEEEVDLILTAMAEILEAEAQA